MGTIDTVCGGARRDLAPYFVACRYPTPGVNSLVVVPGSPDRIGCPALLEGRSGFDARFGPAREAGPSVYEHPLGLTRSAHHSQPGRAPEVSLQIENVKVDQPKGSEPAVPFDLVVWAVVILWGTWLLGLPAAVLRWLSADRHAHDRSIADEAQAWLSRQRSGADGFD
jgi:hypothetical protein